MMRGTKGLYALAAAAALAGACTPEEGREAHLYMLATCEHVCDQFTSEASDAEILQRAGRLKAWAETLPAGPTRTAYLSWADYAVRVELAERAHTKSEKQRAVALAAEIPAPPELGR
jgi:hypothetical protein